LNNQERMQVARDLQTLQEYPEWISWLQAIDDRRENIIKQICSEIDPDERTILIGQLRENKKVANLPENIIELAQQDMKKREAQQI